MSEDIRLSQFQALILVGCFGVYGTFIPSPIDIGELIVYSFYNSAPCITEWCQEMMDRILAYYHIGTFIMIPGGFGTAFYVKKRGG